MAEAGIIPPGNAPGETKWQSRSVARATKPEIRLTAGKPIQGVTLEELIDRIVKENPVRARERRGTGRGWGRVGDG